MNIYVEWAFWTSVTLGTGLALRLTYLCAREAPAFFRERRERQMMEALVNAEMARWDAQDREIQELEALWNLPAREAPHA